MIEFEEGLCDSFSPLCLLLLILSHHPPTKPALSIFPACVYSAIKTGTVGCRDSEPVMCVWGISTRWNTRRDGKKERADEQGRVGLVAVASMI